MSSSKYWSRVVQKRNSEFIRSSKDKPCMDCWQRYHHHVMEFDHVRGKKIFNLSDPRNCSLDKIVNEMNKCELVCANCHRMRTWKRMQYIKTVKDSNERTLFDGI